MVSLERLLTAWRANPKVEATVELCAMLIRASLKSGAGPRLLPPDVVKQFVREARELHPQDVDVAIACSDLLLSAGLRLESGAILRAASEHSPSDARIKDRLRRLMPPDPPDASKGELDTLDIPTTPQEPVPVRQESARRRPTTVGIPAAPPALPALPSDRFRRPSGTVGYEEAGARPTVPSPEPVPAAAPARRQRSATVKFDGKLPDANAPDAPSDDEGPATFIDPRREPATTAPLAPAPRRVDARQEPVAPANQPPAGRFVRRNPTLDFGLVTPDRAAVRARQATTGPQPLGGGPRVAKAPQSPPPASSVASSPSPGSEDSVEEMPTRVNVGETVARPLAGRVMKPLEEAPNEGPTKVVSEVLPNAKPAVSPPVARPAPREPAFKSASDVQAADRLRAEREKAKRDAALSTKWVKSSPGRPSAKSRSLSDDDGADSAVTDVQAGAVEDGETATEVRIGRGDKAGRDPNTLSSAITSLWQRDGIGGAIPIEELLAAKRRASNFEEVGTGDFLSMTGAGGDDSVTTGLRELAPVAVPRPPVGGGVQLALPAVPPSSSPAPAPRTHVLNMVEAMAAAIADPRPPHARSREQQAASRLIEDFATGGEPELRAAAAPAAPQLDEYDGPLVVGPPPRTAPTFGPPPAALLARLTGLNAVAPPGSMRPPGFDGQPQHDPSGWVRATGTAMPAHAWAPAAHAPPSHLMTGLNAGLNVQPGPPTIASLSSSNFRLLVGLSVAIVVVFSLVAVATYVLLAGPAPSAPAPQNSPTTTP